MKSHQLLAVLKENKNKATKAKTEIYQKAQKNVLFQGLSRTYQPNTEDGYIYPPESKLVQIKAQDLIGEFREASKEVIDLCVQQDEANTRAKANVVVDGVIVLSDMPVTTLLYLEKQLDDIRTFVSSLPTLDLEKEWHYDSNRGCYVTAPEQTVKTKKISEFVVAYPATKEHKADVREITKDIPEGVWTKIEFSGALPRDTVKNCLERVNKLHQAIVVAREEANSIEVVKTNISDSLFNYLFNGTMS